MGKKKEFFRKGHFYLIDGESIGMVTETQGYRGHLHVAFKTLARKGHVGTSGLRLPVPFNGGDYTQVYHNDKGTVEKVTVQDFPLYISWHYVSKEFLNLLKEVQHG